jgi:hypothetical protein
LGSLRQRVVMDGRWVDAGLIDQVAGLGRI